MPMPQKPEPRDTRQPPASSMPVPPPFIPMRPPPGPIAINPPPGTPLRLPLRTGYDPLSDDDYAAAAKTLGCEVLMIRAMAIKEGKDHGLGFDEFNRPVILFEPLYFRNRSGHSTEYALKYPDLTHRHPKPHQYGSYTAQWGRLQQAYLLNPRAALESTSWGKFQIVCQLFPLAGFATPESFVSAMCVSEQAQLTAFVHFIQGKKLERVLSEKDWPAIAYGYNGSGYRASKYDEVLQGIYEKLKN